MRLLLGSLSRMTFGLSLIGDSVSRSPDMWGNELTGGCWQLPIPINSARTHRTLFLQLSGRVDLGLTIRTTAWPAISIQSFDL